jgi:hypothetical protein
MTKPAPKRRKDAMSLYAFRLPDAAIAEVDRMARRLEAEGPGRAVTRAEAVRVLLARGLAALERELGRENKRRRQGGAHDAGAGECVMQGAILTELTPILGVRSARVVGAGRRELSGSRARRPEMPTTARPRRLHL